jgi:hypothetical protein
MPVRPLLKAVVTTLFNGWSKSPKSMALNVDPAHIAKIKVSGEGVISLNDQPVTIEELKASLLKIAQLPGSAVSYYRENAVGNPHPNAVLVLNAIIDARLPVKLSSKPDFSDWVGPDGVSHPLR